jgi:hypothetical protein
VLSFSEPAPQQLQHVPRGVDVSAPEGCLASTVGTAQDVPCELENDLLARELGVPELPDLLDLLCLLLGQLLLCLDVHIQVHGLSTACGRYRRQQAASLKATHSHFVEWRGTCEHLGMQTPALESARGQCRTRRSKSGSSTSMPSKRSCVGLQPCQDVIGSH